MSLFLDLVSDDVKKNFKVQFGRKQPLFHHGLYFSSWRYQNRWPDWCFCFQLHAEFKRTFAWSWTEPRQKINFVALCSRDNGTKSKNRFKYLSRDISFLCAQISFCALQIILSAIRVSLPGLLFFSSLRKFTTMDTDLSKESAACLAYLLFVQLIAMDTFPALFKWEYSQLALWCVCSPLQLMCYTTCTLLSVLVLCLFFSATWSTSINSSVGMLSVN